MCMRKNEFTHLCSCAECIWRKHVCELLLSLNRSESEYLYRHDCQWWEDAVLWLRWGGGRRIIMSLGAKGVSNHLMEAVAGRNMNLTNSLMPGNANRWDIMFTVKTKKEAKRGHTTCLLERNVLGCNQKKVLHDTEMKYLVRHLPLWN